MRKLLLPAIIAVAVALFAHYWHYGTSIPSVAGQAPAAANSAITAAFVNQASHVHVEGSGRVVKLLADDNEGSRHQRFLVHVAPGQTILIAHNIDLAPRVAALNEGDNVSFSGEYIWNPKGGIVHWTHHDPHGRHQPGWIKLDGRVFQ